MSDEMFSRSESSTIENNSYFFIKSDLTNNRTLQIGTGKETDETARMSLSGVFRIS